MRVSQHVKERFKQRYKLFFYDFQLDNLDRFIPNLIKEKCIEDISWKTDPFKCNSKKLKPLVDRVFKYNGINTSFFFIVKDDTVVTCFDRF